MVTLDSERQAIDMACNTDLCSLPRLIYATARGYQRAGQYDMERYDGLYGYGWKLHKPSKEGLPNGHRSNYFHTIIYVITNN